MCLYLAVHWSRTQDARADFQDARATAAWVSLKVLLADSMHGNTGECITKLVIASDNMKIKTK